MQARKQIVGKELVDLAIRLAAEVMGEPALNELKHDIGFNAALHLAAMYAPENVEEAMEAMGYPVEAVEVEGMRLYMSSFGGRFYLGYISADHVVVAVLSDYERGLPEAIAAFKAIEEGERGKHPIA